MHLYNATSTNFYCNAWNWVKWIHCIRQLMHSCDQNTRPLAKANDPAGLYGHALSLVAKNDFSGAKEFLDKAGFCMFRCWTGKRTERKWSNGRLVTRIKLRLFALPLNGFGSLLLGLANRTSHSRASQFVKLYINLVVDTTGPAWHLKINTLHISSFESYSRSRSFGFAPSLSLGVVFFCRSALAQSSRVRTLQVRGFEFSLSKHQLRWLFEFSQLGEWFPTNCTVNELLDLHARGGHHQELTPMALEYTIPTLTYRLW